MIAEPRPLVLFINDDPEFLKGAERAISASGYTTATAQSGVDGLRLFQKREPDLVVLDLVMPGIHGIDILRLIREFSDCPIIILTQNDPVELFIQAMEIGVNDYLAKDTPIETILERINLAIGRPETPVRRDPGGD